MPPPMLLNDGTEMPQIAYGLYQVKKDEATRCVADAIKAGYTHFDGAAFYDNEREAGQSLTEACWYTTKVWTTDSTFEDAIQSVKRSRAELGRDLDLALVHWPVPGKHVDMYRALVHCKEELKIVKRIGLSNYTEADYEELEKSGLVKVCRPVVNQIEVSPFLYRKECVDYFQEKHIVVQAFKPLQRGAALQNDTVKAIAQKHSVTAAQVLIKWGLQKGLCVCVKSSNASRMAENLKEWWGLDMDDMDQLDALTTEEALGAWRAHYEKRRAGTAAPWGAGPRPSVEDVAPPDAPSPSPEPAAVPPIEPVPAYEAAAAAPAPEPTTVADADMEPCRVDSSTVEIPAQALEEPGDPRPSPKRARVDDAPAVAEPEPAAAPAPTAAPELAPRKRGMYNEMAVRNAQAHEAEEARKAAGPLDAATVKKMTVAKLRAALAARGLDTKGLKAALQARLLEAIAS
jgi:diketogulonate reductase-like aldo/keto reductase